MSEPQTFESLKIASEKTSWFGQFNDRFSELCSSILVKETRQALKSRQFIWSYFLLLAAVGFWAIASIAFGEWDYDNVGDVIRLGNMLLTGFLVILGFPLGLIIPFSAYRSLAREYEDGTIQLISITTMKPYQIVIGKFGSAILQMLVYLSVLAPCILFTYVLRGISLQHILLSLFIAVGGSICLTILGLFLAGAVRSKALGVGVSVLFVLLLGWLYIMWCALANLLVEAPAFVQNQNFYPVLFGFVAFIGSTAALLLAASVSQISFPSDNRSTKVRVMMIVQQALIIAWMVSLFQIAPYENVTIINFAMIAVCYWLIMGFLMIGETEQMSRRVQRSLPRSFFSKTFFSFLMPGPGRGYLFALTMMLGWCVTLGLMVVFHKSFVLADAANSGRNWRVNEVFRLLEMLGVSFLYTAFYLSLNLVIMKLVLHRLKTEWSTGVGPLISLLTGILSVAFLTIASLIWHFNVSPFGSSSYSPSQVFNMFWTIVEIGDAGFEVGQWACLFLWAVPTSLVTLAGIAIASRELLYRPMSVPERVLIDTNQSTENRLPPGESIDEIFGEIGS